MSSADSTAADAASADAAAGAAGEPDSAQARQPVLRVVRGNPSAQELAALTAVISARQAAAAHAASGHAPQPRSEWGHPARAHRRPLRVGPDQWRRSAWAQ